MNQDDKNNNNSKDRFTIMYLSFFFVFNKIK